MRIHDTISGLRADLATAGKVVLVPTMGNLHAGHIALMREARRHGDTVVASIFVNRLQFRPGEDFDKYPRTFAADCQRLTEAGVDVLFAPDEAEMYPHAQGYYVQPPAEQAEILDGAFRPGHFRGVATVVMKLFQIVQPTVAVFGKKDYQQLLIIRNMVQELSLPITIIGMETTRAADGLALSSRNGYLSAAERAEAPRLHQVLSRIQQAVRQGNKDYPALEQQAVAELAAANWRVDYVAVRKTFDLQLPPEHDSSPSLVVLAAAKLGSTRLIDNLEI